MPARNRILATRRFAPLFVTQFLGAFNDNLLKSALAIVVTYRIADQTHVLTAAQAAATSRSHIDPMSAGRRR